MTKQMKRLGTLCLLLMLAIVSRADGFKDFSVIVNNQNGTLLTAEEQVQGTAIDFEVGVVDGVTTREIPADGTAAGHVSGKFHSEHGCTNLQVQAYEASNVKITVGQCTYSPATITVTDAAGNVVATKTPNGPGCWKNDKNNVDVLYYTGKATTLTITGMDYCPFVAVSALTEDEIAALNAEYTLSYFDYDGTTLIGTQLVKGQEPIGEFAYGAEDCSELMGGAFRGWFNKPEGGRKYKVEDIVEGDMSLYAVSTAIEFAIPGTSFSYNLADPNFDPADHECIDIIGDKAYYHDASHGWAFYNGEKINLTVAGDATITIVNCQYGNGTNIAVVDANTGETIGSLPAKSDADGGVASFEYEGGPTTLSLVMESGGEMYIHSVAIANKNNGGGEHELVTLDNEPVSAFFDFGLGIDGQKADFGEANDYFVTSKVTYGSNLSIFGARQDQTQFMPATQQNEPEGAVTAADESNAIRFIIQPNYGLTFTPKKVSLKTTRFGTDNGLLDFAWENPDKSTVILAQAVKPERNDNVSELSYDIEGATPGEGKCALLINLYHLQSGKQIGFGDILIEGTLSGTEKEVPILATVTINGEEFKAEKIFDDAYEATMELSKKVPMISESNPISATAKKGEVGTIGYVGDETQCVVTIPMTQGETSLDYVLTFVQKPDYKLTYIDTDKQTVLGEFTREKDEVIGEFDVDYNNATAPDGTKVRGWFKKTAGGEKWTAEDVVTSDITLYAVATEIETPSTYKKYVFDLTDKLFDPADHEAFNPSGSFYWHDAQHGWAFKGDAENKIDLLVGPKAIISLTLCRYGNAGDIIITDANGQQIGTLPGKNNEDVDAEIVAFNYEGEGGTITLNLSSEGEMYLHGVKIVNTSETNYESQGQWYFVKPGSAESLLEVLDIVNGANADKDAERSFIFVPDGTYDLGETVKTAISGHNISIIGQSTENTIIVTAPDKSIEGLGSADMFNVSGTNLYLQDLTLQNALDYYGALDNKQVGGRAAVINDAGNRTIGKNIRMLSCQDTYYSSNDNMQSYYEDCDIHGTVDFICGGGDVRFQNTTLSLEPRQLDLKGSRTVVAPRGTVKFGYVFDNCNVVDLAQGNGTWNFGRTWNNQPITVYLNTTLDDNAAATLISSRWIEKGMNNTDPVLFGEYNTLDAAGNNITPASNIIHSHGGDFETIINAEQAAGFTYEMMFSENLEKQWNPAMLTRQLEAPANAKFENGVVSWTPANNGAIAYAIFLNDVFVGITEGSSFDLSGIDFIPGIECITIRSANAMGGFGPAAVVSTGTAEPAEVTLSETGYATFYDSKTNYALPAGLKAYVVSAATTDALTYKEVPMVPAGTAVMLKSDNKRSGRFILQPTGVGGIFIGENLLQGSDETTTTTASGDCLFYKLAFGHSGSANANVFGWYWGADNGAAFQIEGHRAWLAIPKAKASVRGYSLEGDATAINKVAADSQKGEYYNLKGQRVAAPTKGLYIINNKKVVIK
ncbi:MAG: InlB B-repeat-containing protein [Prevotella sp.]|nr:InlB B-repeat-containing protein [Prevotella sp.]